MTTKDGTKYYFGQDEYSQQEVDDDVFKWCLDRVEDTNGNYMTISYIKHDGEIYPELIEYTGNSGVDPSNYIEFVLDEADTRTDIPDNYRTGFPTKIRYRLDRVEVYNIPVSTSVLVRKYVLNYDDSPSSGRSLLSSITQYGKDGGNLLPNVFTYNNDGDVGSYTTYGQDSTLNYPQNCFTGNVNGDGNTDYMCINSNGNVLYGALSNGDGTFSTYSKSTNWPSNLTPHWVFPGDVDGDGVMEIGVGNLNGTLHCFGGSKGKLEWDYIIGANPSDIISCDIDGPVASTLRASTIADPIYGYDPGSESEVAFKQPGAIAVMAVDNLPNELPRDASKGFSENFVKHVIPSFFNGDKDGILHRARMTRNGKLTERYSYLQGYVDGEQ